MGDEELRPAGPPEVTSTVKDSEPGRTLAGERPPEQTRPLSATASDRADVARRGEQATIEATLGIVEANPDAPMIGVETASGPARRAIPVVPGYEILGELGRGGMGVVYHAREVHLNRPCAIKMILSGAHASPESALRFLAEAEAVAKLEHPNVVRIHHIGEADGLPYLELEYVEGGSLASAIDGTPWPARRATAMIEPLALGVAEAHSRGLVHRDLKPGNVLLTADGTPKIIDFGLAKSLDVDIDLTRTDSILGSPCYMAPEQAEGKHHEIGPAADLYALGAILYELLTGRPPFKGASVLETLEQVKTVEPVSPRRLVPGLPADVETICLKCLRKDPARRYESASALAEDLRRFRTGEPIVARPVGPLDRAWRWCRRNPSLAGMVALVLVLLTALLAGASWGMVHFRAQFERLQEEHEHVVQSEKKRLGSLAQSLLTSQPDGVPIIVEELRPARSDFLPTLREASGQGEPGRRLRAAVALTMLGDDRSAFLIDEIARAPASESRNVILALASTDRARLGPLRDGFRADHPPEIRSRFASTLLSCGEPDAARSMLRLGPDPTPRAAFIHHFEDWHGDLANVPSLLREVDDPDFRSGLCAAVGRISPDRLTAQERPAIESACLSLYRDAPEGGVHEAAGWALRQWGVELPAFEPSRGAPAGRGWFVNRSGMTMIEVPSGIIPTRSALMLPFSMSALEVTVEQFRRFLDDPETPADEKPSGMPFPDPDSIPGSRPGDPIGFVSPFDAALFCNWLSRKEGRQPCYERTAPGPNMPFRCRFEADGYRLPARSEYEYAARALATTKTAVGDATRYLADYANMAADRAEPPGARLPNGWGFHDLLGNVWEMVWASGQDFPAGSIHPLGPLETAQKSIVGSCYGGGPFYVPFERIINQAPTHRNPLNDPSVGFRVACIGDPEVRDSLAKPGPAARKPDLRAFRWINPRDGEALLAFGDLLRDAGHLERAVAAYRESARLLTDDPRAFAHLGLALSLSGDPAGAAEAYRAAIRPRRDRIGRESVLLDIARRDPWLHDQAVGRLFADRSNNAYANLLEAILLRAYGPDPVAYRKVCLKQLEQFEHSADASIAAHAAHVAALPADPVVDPDRVVAIAERLRDSRVGWQQFVLGLAYYRTGRLEVAIRSLKRSGEVTPNWPATALNWPVLAMAHHKLGQASEARSWLEAADRAIIPTEPSWQDPAELVLLRDEARLLIRGTVAPAEPGPIDPIRTAEFLGQVGLQDEAIRMYLEAARCRPFNQITGSLFRTRRMEEALVVCRELIRLQPRSLDAHAYLGYALLESKRPAEAIEELREAIRIDPRYGPAYRHLDLALKGVNNLDRVGDLVDLVEAAPSNDPDILRLKNNLAWRQVASPGSRRHPAAIDQAVRLMRAVVAARPTDGTHHNTLGVALVRSRRWDEAIVELDRSVRLLGDRHYAFNGFFLAIAHWHLGHETKARAEFDRSAAWAKRNAPDDPELRQIRAEVAALLRLDADFPARPFAR